MKVCFSLTNLELGGAQVFVCQLANQLAARGHQVFIYDHWPEYRDQGVAGLVGSRVTLLSYSESETFRAVVWKLNALFRHTRLSKNFRHEINRRSFFRKMRKLDIEVVNSHMQFSDQVICGKDVSFNFKLVVSLHGEYEMLAGEVTQSVAERHFIAMLRKTAAIVYTAEKNLLIGKSSGRLPPLHRIGVGIDPDAFPIKSVGKKMAGFEESDFVVGMVSRGIPEKGWDWCIEIVARYNAGNKKKIKLLMIGNGDYLSSLVTERTTSDMKLLQFHGDMKAYFSWYQVFDVFLFPTRFSGESFPNVVIESLYWGIPVIASDAGSIADMLRAGTDLSAGVCVDVSGPDTVEKFVSALTYLVGDDAARSRMATNARAIFPEFDVRRVAGQYTALFNDVLAPSGTSASP